MTLKLQKKINLCQGSVAIVLPEEIQQKITNYEAIYFKGQNGWRVIFAFVKNIILKQAPKLIQRSDQTGRNLQQKKKGFPLQCHWQYSGFLFLTGRCHIGSFSFNIIIMILFSYGLHQEKKLTFVMLSIICLY